MPTYKVKVDLPNIPRVNQIEGDDKSAALVEVLHLGLFPNGATTTIKDDELTGQADVRIAAWSIATGKDWPEDGTLVIDNSEADAQRKEALDALKADEPETFAEVQDTQNLQSELDLSGSES